ncbi:hypothetical protein DIPPA_56864 [Diplonema papillatum]|nr:hypothetical protein DIPPA_56864 [Diplonema papillatum]
MDSALGNAVLGMALYFVSVVILVCLTAFLSDIHSWWQAAHGSHKEIGTSAPASATPYRYLPHTLSASPGLDGGSFF